MRYRYCRVIGVSNTVKANASLGYDSQTGSEHSSH